MVSAQILVLGLIFLVVLGSFAVAELRTYSTQLIALLLIFYFILEHLRKRQRRVQAVRNIEDEETLLFLTTYLKPKLESLIDISLNEDNLELVRKQLELTAREVDQFLEEKEREVAKQDSV